MAGLYLYEGPVMRFGFCVQDKWRGETVAVSEKKARSNLMYQYKKQLGELPSSKIDLPGKIQRIADV